MTDFGNRLKKTMEERGISGSELSRLSGVGKNLISYYVHGKCLAKQDKVYLLAKALHVDPGWLMTGVEPNRGERKVFIPDTEMFRKVMENMTAADYDMVMEAFTRTQERMREMGII